MCASRWTSPACTPDLALKVRSLSPSCLSELVDGGIDGAQPPPGVKGAAMVAFRPSGGWTWIWWSKKLDLSGKVIISALASETCCAGDSVCKEDFLSKSSSLKFSFFMSCLSCSSFSSLGLTKISLNRIISPSALLIGI